MPELRRGFFAKFAANVATLLLGLASISLVPRALGPAAYGSFEFLTSFFQQVTGFLDMGTSTCFYTKASQRPQDRGLMRFYFFFTMTVGVGMLAISVGLTQLSVGGLIWPEQQWQFVLLACLVGWLTWVTQVTQKALDAKGHTVQSERILLAQRFFSMGLLVLLFLSGNLNLAGYFYYFVTMHALLLFFWGRLVLREKTVVGESRLLEATSTSGKYVGEFVQYSSPLLIYALIGLVVGIADRWLLQYWGGGEEQGFFGLAFRVGAVCFLFTSAMTQLLTREFSRAWAEEDHARIADLFSRYIPMFYAIAAYFSIFVAWRAADVVQLFGGQAFSGAATALAVMALYPMHQTYGQLSGSVFFASGQTGLYRNIGVIFMLTGLPVLYILLAPAGYGGVQMGAFGLAVKMVAMQFIAVNAQLWFNARLLKLDFYWFLRHQLLVAAALGGCAWLATAGMARLGLSPWEDFILSGVAYTALTVALAHWAPSLFSLRRGELVRRLAFWKDK